MRHLRCSQQGLSENKDIMPCIVVQAVADDFGNHSVGSNSNSRPWSHIRTGRPGPSTRFHGKCSIFNAASPGRFSRRSIHLLTGRLILASISLPFQCAFRTDVSDGATRKEYSRSHLQRRLTRPQFCACGACFLLRSSTPIIS